MKTLNKIIKLMMLGIAFSFMTSCEVGYVATIPGTGPEVIVGTAPFAGAIWIGPEWVWRGGRYVSVGGHWEHPRGTWHSGTWIQRGGGYHWNRGYWR